MDLQGKIEKFNVPDIFQLISSGCRTGTLGVRQDSRSVLFYFDDGQITYGYTPDQHSRLGDRLIAKNFINDNSLKDSLQKQKQQFGQKRLGRILVDDKLIDEKQLTSVLTEQITDIVSRVMAWHKGVFKFYDEKFPTREELKLSIPTEKLILEGAHRVDELIRLRQKLPDSDMVFKIKQAVDNSEINLKLSAREWSVLTFCDGNTNLQSIMDKPGFDPIQTLKTLIKFLDDSLIEISRLTGSDLSSRYSPRLESKISSLAEVFKEFLKKG